MQSPAAREKTVFISLGISFSPHILIACNTAFFGSLQ